MIRDCLSLLLLLPTILFSQQISKAHIVEIEHSKVKSQFSIADNLSNLNLFYEIKNSIKLIQVDSTLEYLGELTIDFDNKYDERLGHIIKPNGDINIYYRKGKSDEYIVLKLYKNEGFKTLPFQLELKKEKILGTFVAQNEFHIITFIKNQSKLFRYSFDDYKFSKHEYNLSDERFIHFDNKPTKLGSFLYENCECTFLEDELYSVTTSTKNIKLFPNENSFFMSLNHRRSMTTVYEFSLKDGSYEKYNFQFPSYLFKNMDFVYSNSFISEDKIFQIISSGSKLNLSVFDLRKMVKLQEFNANENQVITFKNSPIFSRNPTKGFFMKPKTKEIKTDELLGNDLGVLVRKQKERFLLTIGAKIIYGGGPVGTFGSPSGGFTPTVTASGITYSYNPSINSFYSYSNESIVFFNSILNPLTLENELMDAPKDIFEEMFEYTKDKKKLKLEEVSKLKKVLVHSYYVPKEKKVYLASFSDD